MPRGGGEPTATSFPASDGSATIAEEAYIASMSPKRIWRRHRVMARGKARPRAESWSWPARAGKTARLVVPGAGRVEWAGDTTPGGGRGIHGLLGGERPLSRGDGARKGRGGGRSATCGRTAEG